MVKMKLTPVWKEVRVDLETPVSAFLKLQKTGARFLLESAEKGEKIGRYSFIGLNPSSTLIIEENRLILNGREVPFQKNNFLNMLKEIVFSHRIISNTAGSPFIGGWVGFLGYDVIRFFENLPARPSSDMGFPEGYLYMVNNVMVFDHLKHKAKVISLVDSPKKRQKALEKIDDIVQALNAPLNQGKKINKTLECRRPQSNFSHGEFEDIVQKAKEYILAGDIFQVVLSQRFTGKTAVQPFEIYRMLRMINPSPYMFFLDFGDFHLVGSSPEALVRLNKETALLHPIAGTRPRGKTPKEDSQLEEELFQSEKEKAEHVMLVDLARNDLGKVCLPHTIKVREKMNLEKYSHVMHLVSEVTGSLDPEMDALDLFKAVFPAGTVTGAPKIRAMEIIDELEKSARGPYAGAVGYFGLDGYMDMCIAIRMIIHQKGNYYLQAGAGIVADSIPSFEYRETLNKMEGLYQALKMSEEQ